MAMVCDMYAHSFDLLYSTTPIPGIDGNSAWDREGLNPIQSTLLTEIGKGFVSRLQPCRSIGSLSWCSSSPTSFFFLFLVLERLSVMNKSMQLMTEVLELEPD